MARSRREKLLLNIGEQIRKFRKEKELTQEQLARIVQMDRGKLSKIESGQANITIETLVKISAALGKKIQIVIKR